MGGQEHTAPETIVIDVHLIGYTADLRHIVLDLDPDQGRGRYRLEIDLDLFLTIDEIRALRRAAGLEAGPHEGTVDEVQETSTPSIGETSDAPGEESIGRDEADVSAPVHEPSELASPPAASESKEKRSEGATEPPQPESRLTPAEIQTLLRAGRSLKTVAKLAGIDVRRVERWLPPILAERAQVLQEAHATPLGSSAGHSRQSLAAAVTHNLSLRGSDPDHAAWSANRRMDGRWTVQLRYRDGNRSRCASWSFDRREQTLTAGSQLAHELGWTDDAGAPGEGERPAPSLDGAQALVDARFVEGAPPEAVQEGEIA